MSYTCYYLLHAFSHSSLLSFFFNATATTEIYTLSLHDALPILYRRSGDPPAVPPHDGRRDLGFQRQGQPAYRPLDRKSTRLNSSHRCISYAVFCLKKKKIEERVLSVEPRDTAE